MARSEIVTIGALLLFFAMIAYFWTIPESGYTIPQAQAVCSSDWVQWALMFSDDPEAREACNTIAMYAAAIYGAGLLGIILIIVGAVMTGKKEDEGHEEKVVAKEEKKETYQEILKQTFTKEEPPKVEPAKEEKPKEDFESSFIAVREYGKGKKPNKTAVRGTIIAGVSVFAVVILIYGMGEFQQAENQKVQDESMVEQRGIVAEDEEQTQRIQEETPKSYTKPLPSSNCSGSAECFTGTVKAVIDGDTLSVKVGGNALDIVFIRLSLTDTPEKDQYGYDQATRYTEKLCPVGSKILVDQDDLQPVDVYGRMLAKVTCANMVLNSNLLYNHHGDISTQYCSTSEFSGEAWAQEFGCTRNNSQYKPPQSCDPSYPDFCMPSPPPDLDCKDIAQKRFTVIGSDPHRFDGDNDGIGCESTSSSQSSSSQSTTQKTSCDPSYPDFCIPPSPPDLDCKDIAQKRFTVIGSDPHRFDGDGDGIGCESG